MTAMATPASLDRDGGALLVQELRPYPGRTAVVARMVAACVVTMLVVMTAKLPFGFLAAFYALAVSRESPGRAVRAGFAMIGALAAGVALTVLGLQWVAADPVLYWLFVVTRFFLVFFLARTMVDPGGALGFGVIVVASIVLWDRPPLGAEGQVQAILGTALGMAVGTLVTVAVEWPFASRADLDAVRAGGGHGSGCLFVGDAFTNVDHLVFALRGCLAATLCYLAYSWAAWPGIAVCTMTCFLAAPVAPLGTPTERLLIRLAGVALGGLVLGVGSQTLVLPLVDSAGGFVLAFGAACALISWCATAGPRLAYGGRQMGLAYFLTMFQTAGLNPSLVMSRDRLVGVILGVLTMWLVFDAFPTRQEADR